MSMQVGQYVLRSPLKVYRNERNFPDADCGLPCLYWKGHFPANYLLPVPPAAIFKRTQSLQVRSHIFLL